MNIRRLFLFFLIILPFVAKAEEKRVIINGKVNIIKDLVDENGKQYKVIEYRGDGGQDDPNVHHPAPNKDDLVFLKAKEQEPELFLEEEPIPDTTIPLAEQPDYLERKKEYDRKFTEYKKRNGML